ncbi:RluA family pseudouridine synthase [Alteribacter natronophilus]|uniref:RluA family pseudouridine synthase n=1 Tax=Alteribacter natronophilus TaxID=2583810 RepID=UPI0024824C90|nr:RluA family pseudouridine synthase [Alteribacter natronophilus]
MLLREFLRSHRNMSRKTLAEIKHGGGKLLLNRVEETVRSTVAEGDLVTVVFPPEQPSPAIVPIDLPLMVIYEDDHLLVVSKPPGLPTVPSPDSPGRSLAGAAAAYFLQRKIPSTFHAVSRLDRDTSGLVVLAKHRYAHHQLSEQGAARTYLAIVQGTLSEKCGKIDQPIGRKPGSIIERTVQPGGKRAVTHFEVIGEGNGLTLVRVHLETGRTHQIRVHFSHKGHPLAGDTLYGGDGSLIGRQALHAAETSFRHPITGKLLQFKADIPADMNNLWRRA